MYHVMARGVERRAIFRDDTDRQNFLGRLEAVAEEEEEDLAVFAYVLMDNRFMCWCTAAGDRQPDGLRRPRDS